MLHATFMHMQNTTTQASSSQLASEPAGSGEASFRGDVALVIFLAERLLLWLGDRAASLRFPWCVGVIGPVASALLDFAGDGVATALLDFAGDGVATAFLDFAGDGVATASMDFAVGTAFLDFAGDGVATAFLDFAGEAVGTAFLDFAGDGVAPASPEHGFWCCSAAPGRGEASLVVGAGTSIEAKCSAAACFLLPQGIRGVGGGDARRWRALMKSSSSTAA